VQCPENVVACGVKAVVLNDGHKLPTVKGAGELHVMRDLLAGVVEAAQLQQENIVELRKRACAGSRADRAAGLASSLERLATVEGVEDLCELNERTLGDFVDERNRKDRELLISGELRLTRWT
jgi:hypothetical protein